MKTKLVDFVNLKHIVFTVEMIEQQKKDPVLPVQYTAMLSTIHIWAR